MKLWILVFMLAFAGLFCVFALSPLNSKWIIVGTICGVAAVLLSITLAIVDFYKNKDKK